MKTKHPHLFAAYLAAGILALFACGTSLCPAQQSTQQLYQEALQAYYRGDYDSAEAGLQRVLAADPRHANARNYLGQIAFRKKNTQTSAGAQIQRNLEQVIVPSLQFEDASLGSVLEYITEKSAELTGEKFRPNIIYKGTVEELQSKKVSFKLSNVPMSVVLQYVGDFTDTQFTYDKYAIIGTPKRDVVKKTEEEVAAEAAAAAEKAKAPDEIKPAQDPFGN